VCQVRPDGGEPLVASEQHLAVQHGHGVHVDVANGPRLLKLSGSALGSPTGPGRAEGRRVAVLQVYRPPNAACARVGGREASAVCRREACRRVRQVHELMRGELTFRNADCLAAGQAGGPATRPAPPHASPRHSAAATPAPAKAAAPRKTLTPSATAPGETGFA
jgi:hypothetical protein